MSTSNVFSYSVLTLFVAAVAGAYAFGFFQPVHTSGATTVRWLIAHEPIDLFDDAAREFTKTFEEYHGGRIDLVMLSPQDLGFEDNVPTEDVLRMLEEGEFDLATTFTTGIASAYPAFEAVNQPFLFDNFEEAEAELDGTFGAEMLADLSENSPFRGLAFTLSGGFVAIASDKAQLVRPEDFKNKTIVTVGGAVGKDTLRAWGAQPAAASDVGSLSDIDGVEFTYTRIAALNGMPEYVRHISETNHSLFLTAILASDSFYDALSEEERAALEAAAQAAAATERADSIALGTKVRQELVESGTIVIELSPEQRATLKEMAR